MSPATSAFLNILRIAAAFIVFINHCAQFWNPRVFAVTAPIAHSAVIIFFVLSGYVIAFSTLTKEPNLKSYVSARLSRLYSVVLPALVLTFLLQKVGSAVNPGFYAGLSRGFEGFRCILAACFLQNIWNFSASPATNAPFWSLSYEFWYYVFFAVAVFVRPRRARFYVLMALSLLVGPNILLLMPCWLLGAGLFFSRARLSSVISKPRIVFPISLVAVVMAGGFLRPFPYDLSNKRYLFSGAFLTDWTMALAVACAIASFDGLFLPGPPERLGFWIRYLADHTFSLYL